MTLVISSGEEHEFAGDSERSGKKGFTSEKKPKNTIPGRG
jgi:hypothetical protein